MGFADELREAVDSIKLDGSDDSPVELTCEEMSLFLDENPVVLAIADELGGFAEAIMFLDEFTAFIGDFPTPRQVIKLFEKMHSPFKNKNSLTLDASRIGPPNPRSQVKDWDCDASGLGVQKCTNKDGAVRIINMKRYYTSGDKAEYMKVWRKKTAAAGK